MFGAENQPISENNKNTIVVTHKDINPSRPIINKDSFFFVRTTLITLKVTINIVTITKRGTMMIFIFKYNVGGKRQTTAMRGLCYSAQTSTAKGCPLNHLCYVLVLTKTG